MKCLFGLLSILPAALLISCNSTPDLTKGDVYTILNEIIADDSLRLYSICWQPDKLQILIEYGFTHKDKKFIDRQNEIFEDFKFEPNRLKFYSRGKKHLLSVYIDTSCKKGILNHLSFPLISANRQRVVIENTEDCHCMLGGHGGKYLYLKQNGHWRREKSFDQWISQNANGNLRGQIAQQATSGLAKY